MPLSGNALKLIAALSMLFDHIGIMFFPKILLFRVFGRLAFPLFAFFIAEGCRYTKNRARYLGTMAAMATIFQIVYFVAMKRLYMSVFVTFTLSILLIYLLDECKKAFAEEKVNAWKSAFWLLAFTLALVGVYLLKWTTAFSGALLPFAPPSFKGARAN